MPSPQSLSGVSLHRLVESAVEGAEPEVRALLNMVVPSLIECLAAVLVEKNDGQSTSERLALRQQIIRRLLILVADPNFLAEWRRAPAKDAWRVIEKRTERLAAGLRDQAWVERALDPRHPTAKGLLFVRLRKLFRRAANFRGTSADEREDAFQSFSVWLLANEGRNLRRWDPEGGRSFDSWYFARALNQLDTRRRDAAAPHTSDNADELGYNEESRFTSRMHIEAIERWLKSNCDEDEYNMFIRNVVEQQSATEIAAEMGIKPGVIYTTIWRLRKGLESLQPT